MSATTPAPAPGPTTAPTAAPRRPAAARAEQPGSFADVLEATVPAASAPDRPSKAPGRSDDGATDVKAVGDAPADVPAPEPVPVAPAVPVAQPLVLALAPENQGSGDVKPETDDAIAAAEASGTIPVTAPVVPPAPPASPAASAAPVAPLPLPAKTSEAALPTSAAPSLDEAADAALPTSPPSAPMPAAPEGTRAVTAPDAGNAAVASGATAAGPATPAAAAAAQSAADGDAAKPAAGKPAAEMPPPVSTVSDLAAEPSSPLLTAPATAAPAGELAATHTTGLSTVSQTALNATAQIAAQIVRKLEGQSTRFEMALTPDDLGRVDVSLDIDADGQLSARLAFDNPLAAADLKGRVDELRRQLTDAGFTVADDAFSFDQRQPSAGNGNGFDRGSDRHPGRAFGAASRLSSDADMGLNPPRWMSLTLTPERVDMKV